MPEEKIFPVPPERRVEKYWTLLNDVVDPELGIGVVDLGLIYNVEIKDARAIVTMTLTSAGCPIGPTIMRQVEDKMKQFPGVKESAVNLIWNPIWTPDKINPDIRGMLSI